MMSEAKTKARATKGTGLKILTPKQTLQRLPIALAQVKAGNNSEKFVKWNEENCLFFASIKRNHKKSIQQHNRIYSIKFHATYKRWILYLWIQKTVKHLSHIF